MPPASPVRRALRALGPLAVAPAALAALLAAPAIGRAQVATIDEGSFTVSRGGTRLGREEFRIVRQPAGGGSAFMARSTGQFGDRRVAPVLQTDVDGAPERYQVEVRRNGAVEQRVSAQVAGSHFRAQSVSDGGEAAREFLIDRGTLVVDDEVFHQYYFAVRRAQSGSGAASMLTPRRGVQSAVTIALDAPERVTVGGQSLAARRFVVTDAAGGRREVWADDAGRVLRVRLPADGVEALRDDPPR